MTLSEMVHSVVIPWYAGWGRRTRVEGFRETDDVFLFIFFFLKAFHCFVQ